MGKLNHLELEYKKKITHVYFYIQNKVYTSMPVSVFFF